MKKNQSLIVKTSSNTSSTRGKIEEESPFTGLIEPIQGIWDGQLCIKKAIYAHKLYKALGLNQSQYSRWIKSQIKSNSWGEGSDWIKVTSTIRSSNNYALRVVFVKSLCSRLHDKVKAKILWDWIGKETAGFYAAMDAVKKVDDVIGITKYANEIRAAAEAIAKKAIVEAEVTRKRAEVILWESPAYSRSKKVAQEQRANEVNRLLRTFAKMQGLSSESYSDLYRSAYRRLLMYAGISWKQEFWESDNKLEFLREKDPIWLSRLIDICREMYIDPTRWNINEGMISYYEERKQITSEVGL